MGYRYLTYLWICPRPISTSVIKMSRGEDVFFVPGIALSSWVFGGLCIAGIWQQQH